MRVLGHRMVDNMVGTLATVRDRLGESEDKFLATASLGSSLLFLALTSAAFAIAAGLLDSTYAATLVPLASLGLSLWMVLVFAAWMVLVSTHILALTPRPRPSGAMDGMSAKP